jgi:hypothetical protein
MRRRKEIDMKAAWYRQQGPSHAIPLIIPNSDGAGVGSRRDIN